MRLVSMMQFWLEVDEDAHTTPENAWMRCVDPAVPGSNVQDIADQAAAQLAQLPGITRSRVMLASVEPLTGTLRATFDEQRRDEHRLLGDGGVAGTLDTFDTAVTAVKGSPERS